MSWDRTFCDRGNDAKEKCRKCAYYLDKKAYEALCKARGCTVYLSFYMTPPCADKPMKNKEQKGEK